MTKPTMWLCVQRRLRSAWASAQADQSLRCPHEESLGPRLISLRCPHEESLGPWPPIQRRAKTLIRLGGCPGWSESSLGAQTHCWFCHVAAQMDLECARCTKHPVSFAILLSQIAPFKTKIEKNETLAHLHIILIWLTESHVESHHTYSTVALFNRVDHSLDIFNHIVCVSCN